MSFSIEFADDAQEYQARIKVVGCGGAGGNALNTMIHYGLEGVEFTAINTDAQALNANAAPNKIPIGLNVTRGLGAGANPEKGRKAAEEDLNRVKEAIQGSDMVFVTAGMGGGTGTGAAPVVARLAREEGALTVGVVTKPFLFEGRTRARRAEQGLAELGEHVDTLITIPNEKLMSLDDEELSFVDAFRKADEVLFHAVKGISDLITQDGIVNVDFADVRTVMDQMGRALMGTGCAKGEGRARLAAEQAIASPLLDDISVEGAMGVLINVVGGRDMRMSEINDAARFVQEQAHEDANIIFGASIDDSMEDAFKVTVIATGFDRCLPEPAPVVFRQNVRQPGVPAEQMSAPPMHQDIYVSHGRPTERPSEMPASRPTRPEPEYVAAGGRRRPPARTAGTLGDAAPGSGPVLRERITFPSNMEHERDWDTPTFQRRRHPSED